ncbi:hypothetical protein [Bradyrhizobium sp. STM 3562]|uniref:bestrophin-like domain n=1 Tax=Bradyrhizobium sp. STM 3562 TaxID=578924 RepID=UPI00388EC7E5
MSDWLHNLPVIWMALVVFGATYLLAVLVQTIVGMLATGERVRAFKAVSPGMLPPLGIIFGLFVAFTAAQVWSDNDHASAAVNREASALKSALVLAAVFPGEPEAHLRSLIQRHIEETANKEWPMMVRHVATLSISPAPLTEALQQTLALSPNNPGQQIAQREIAMSLENALEARRQRILVSRSHVNLTKWACLFLQAACALLAIAVVHSDNRLASAISMGAFATGVAASVLLILAHDEPFIGQVSVGPQPLLQVMPGLAGG